MDNTAALAPSLPLWAQSILTVVLFFALLWALFKMQDWSARVVCIAAWVRYIVASYHTYTFPPYIAGVSIASLSAMIVSVFGIMAIQKRHLLLKSLIPIYGLMFVAVLSGLFSRDLGGIAAVLTKLTYMIVIAVCIMEAISRRGEKILAPLIVGFFPPYAFQWMSIVLNVPKAGERDGSASFIGGYGHEGAFSEMLLSAIVVAGLTRSLSATTRVAIIITGLAGVVMANYRTTIIAFLPFLLLVLVVEPLRNVRPAIRALALSVYAMLIPLFLMTAGSDMASRFSDLLSIPQVVRLVTTSPGDFNREDAAIMSGRPLLWARYYEAFDQGNTRQQLIGFGPEKRVPVMNSENGPDVYAHNTLISASYEYGIVGVLAYCAFFAYMIVMGLRAPKSKRPQILTLALSLFILNMATMPMWQFEGIILTGLFWGYAMYCERLAQPAGRVRTLAHLPASASQMPTRSARPRHARSTMRQG